MSLTITKRSTDIHYSFNKRELDLSLININIMEH